MTFANRPRLRKTTMGIVGVGATVAGGGVPPVPIGGGPGFIP